MGGKSQHDSRCGKCMGTVTPDERNNMSKGMKRGKNRCPIVALLTNYVQQTQEAQTHNKYELVSQSFTKISDRQSDHRISYLND